MKSTLLGTEKEPFLPATHRIRKLPFMIGKPTFEAVQAAYLRAASVVFCEEKVADQIAARFKPAKVEEAVEAQPAPAPKVKQVEEVPEAVKYSEEEDPLFTALHVASQSDDVMPFWRSWRMVPILRLVMERAECLTISAPLRRPGRPSGAGVAPTRTLGTGPQPRSLKASPRKLSRERRTRRRKSERNKRKNKR